MNGREESLGVAVVEMAPGGAQLYKVLAQRRLQDCAANALLQGPLLHLRSLLSL